MPTNIGDGGITTEGIARIDKADIERLHQHKLQLDDIVFSRRGDVTKNALVRIHEVGWLCGTGCLKVRLGSQRIANAKFISYCLRLPAAKEWLVRHAVGATMPNLNTGILSAIPITLPPLSSQLEIAAALGTIDDRIALLRETNTTLEAIAQALFKSWFVDFDPVRAKMEGRPPEGMDEATAALFPSAFEESALGLIPKGWTASTLGTLCELTKGCSYKGEGLSETNGAYMFNLGCFNAQRVFASEKLKRYVGEYRPRHEVVPGDLIIANTDMTQARDILGRPALVPKGFEPGFISHHVYRVTIKDSDVRRSQALRQFLFFTFREPMFRERAIGFATGTTVLALPATAVLECPTHCPLPSVLLAWSEVVTPLFDAIQGNERIAERLGDIRDTLLPRLISGQLRLPEAQAELEAVHAF